MSANDELMIAIELADTPDEAALALVDEGLERHNYAVAPLNEVAPLAAFARTPDGTLIGGAVGRTWGQCCELLELWVDEAQRGQGVASRLLAAFEAHAADRGCTVYYLTTLSYQAPGFYLKQGYAERARIAGYPNGIVKFLMVKEC